MQPGDEFGQSGKKLQLVQAGILGEQLTQGQAGQRLVMHHRAVWIAQSIELQYMGAGYAEAFELGGVIGKTPGRWVEGGFRQPALTAEQLEKGAVNQAQYFLAKEVLLQYLSVFPPVIVLC